MHEPDDYVRDLHAGVVDVVLDFHAVATRLENSDEGVSQHRVSHMADMGRLVGIDAGVFDHQLAILWRRANQRRVLDGLLI